MGCGCSCVLEMTLELGQRSLAPPALPGAAFFGFVSDLGYSQAHIVLGFKCGAPALPAKPAPRPRVSTLKTCLMGRICPNSQFLPSEILSCTLSWCEWDVCSFTLALSLLQALARDAPVSQVPAIPHDPLGAHTSHSQLHSHVLQTVQLQLPVLLGLFFSAVWAKPTWDEPFSEHKVLWPSQAFASTSLKPAVHPRTSSFCRWETSREAQRRRVGVWPFLSGLPATVHVCMCVRSHVDVVRACA